MASQTDAESNQMTPRQTVTLGFGKQNHKSCDACRIRKVRCPGPAKPDFGPCATCVRRNKPCHFSSKKLARRKNVSEQFLSPKPTPKSKSSTPGIDNDEPIPAAVSSLQPDFFSGDSVSKTPSSEGNKHQLPVLHVDSLLTRSSKTSPSEAEDETPPFIRGNGIFAGDLSLTFFSETRLQSLASAAATKYIRLYFECVHPLYPFLDREAFERTFANPDFFEIVNQSRAWSCLYHSVLAMGCQCDGGGSFEPGVGDAWNLFFVALSLLPDIMLQPDSLLVLQAMAAMAIQCSGISCVMMEHVITSEAARRAQNLSTSNFSGPRAKAYQRTFWCLYAIEKTSSFYFGRSSAFIDGDISCPIPHVPESVFGDFDWFLSIIRHARIISQTYSSLFSVAVANKPNAYYMDIIDQLNQKHDDWRMSIPDTGFRPGGLKPPSSIHCGVEREAAVMIHYYHDGLQLTLARATLHRLSRLSRADDPLIAAQQKATMEAVLSASRSVLERTVLVNVDPHTSIWILAGIPIIGLFVVFDFVIHSPLHVNTPSHLALLDMAGGHFSRIEYRSQGYLPGSLISEFAHIAREYVNDAHQKQEARATQAQTLPEIVNVPQPQQGAAQVQAMANAPKVGPKEGIPSDMDNVASAELPDFSMAFNGFPDYTPSNATTGTDVMGIFNYYLPELDPMFSQGLDEDGSHALGCQRQLSKGRALFVASGWNPGTYVLGFCD
ncbi:ABC-transporter-regulating transcription factor like protein [Verticillium longisporum]|nr:ABC-transporter-regulating transcription factor like protein [Verticillium longisporum]